MAIDIKSRLIERVVVEKVITFTPQDLTARGGGAYELEQFVRRVLQLVKQEGRRPLVVIDLGAVKEIDSAGLGSLVSIFASMVTAGGSFKLIRVSPEMQKLLTIAKLREVFPHCGTEEEAIAEFQLSTQKT